MGSAGSPFLSLFAFDTLHRTPDCGVYAPPVKQIRSEN